MTWFALILAAGRGPDDPMAKAYGVSHKCALPVHGVPMLRRVVEALRKSPDIPRIAVSIDAPERVAEALGEAASGITVLRSENSAPRSALRAIEQANHYPVLITTGDHALLTADMVSHFCREASAQNADFSAGLARAETILAAYPQSVRTFFAFGADRVSGCNLFAVHTPKGLKVLERWQFLEAVRKKPWRLVAAFGPLALLRFLLGQMSLDSVFRVVSQRLGIVAKPVLMPYAEAAIDVDKPADLELAEAILKQREAAHPAG
jgi:GTP:adenosylcobinamide-phosphate guanylyltransferase